MGSQSGRDADRVEAFVSAIERYEPKLVPPSHGDSFRIFCGFISRSVDGRFLDRHPADELLPDLEHLMCAARRRENNEIKVRIELNEVGDERRGVLTTCVEDQRFLFSTVRLALDALGVRMVRSFNTVIPIRRDTTGEISAVGTTDAQSESFIWAQIEASDLAQKRVALEQAILERLQDTRLAVTDFPNLVTAVERLAVQCERLARDRPDHRRIHADNARLLRWLMDEHFVLLGSRYIAPADGERLEFLGDFGIGRSDKRERSVHLDSAEHDVFEAGPIQPFFWIRKSDTKSWLYRTGLTDHILVQCHSDDGQDAGLFVIEGIFSYLALTEPRVNIPLLDHQLDDICVRLQAERGSHRHRTIRNAFNSLPLEYLFSLQDDDVFKLVTQLLNVESGNRLQTEVICDELQETAFIFITLPREHYSDELRAMIRQLLKMRFRAQSIDGGIYAGGADTVAAHFFLSGVRPLADDADEALQDEIEQLSRPWNDLLSDELHRAHDATTARRLHSHYGDAFPRRYREETSISRAVADIDLLERLHEQGGLTCDIYRERADERLGVTRLRLFESHPRLLSDVLPILDNLGLIVIDQFPTAVQVQGRAESIIATFRVSGVQGMKIDLITRRNRLRAAVKAALIGATDSDAFNRLLIFADIPWPYVALLRTYQSYARQLGSPYGHAMVRDTLEKNGSVVRALIEIFRSRFDPRIEGLNPKEVCDKRRDLMERAEHTFEAVMEGVRDLAGDRVLRMFHNLIDATVRTNFYARDPMVKHQLVIKLDPAIITRIPEPRPYREIYVHHPMVAGLHLRGGEIARGGLRFSDRTLDFRTEVLGLMATQNLKNVLIIPRGAKGAFISRRRPSPGRSMKDIGTECYRHFVRGLLDVTDNVVDGEVITPPGVLRHDGPDPYLVVAADKGTAHLSDTANVIATERDFWLGDAFASGGSKGYDHKEDGITAKGAWQCVRRHFSEMRMDPEKDRIKVVGVGDMSGDVFGNGMLLSRSMQLCAAFDHRDIFIDPDPDPTKSWEARLALFEMKGHSSWQDYPKDIISQGGGVYSRGAKSIALTNEARELLGFGADVISLSGPELARAILCAEVDMLWNGGIGTYIRADDETDMEVGDPTNDGLRIGASKVRARVMGEGGNLGITPRGRIQLASQGVRLNTDAMDNAAGVNLSDHEVNLKLLFAQAVRDGEMTVSERDTMMEEVREEVNQMVRYQNWTQSRMLSLDQIRSRRDLARFHRAQIYLSEQVPFDPAAFDLPNEATFQSRTDSEEGLYRPELSALAAQAKLCLREALEHSPLFDAKRLRSFLFAYWPKVVSERFGKYIETHPLAGNIARTVLTNTIIDDAGASWVAELSMGIGCPAGEVAEGFLQARELLGIVKLKERIDEAAPNLDSATEYMARLIIEESTEVVCMWLLRRPQLIDEYFSEAFAMIVEGLPDLLPPQHQEIYRGQKVELGLSRVPPDLAEDFTRLSFFEDALDIAKCACLTGKPISLCTRAFYLAGDTSGVLDLASQAVMAGSSSLLERPARLALRDRLRSLLVSICMRILGKHQSKDGDDNLDVSDEVMSWLQGIREEVNLLGGEDDATISYPSGAQKGFGATRAESDSLATLVMVTDRVGRALGAASFG